MKTPPITSSSIQRALLVASLTLGWVLLGPLLGEISPPAALSQTGSATGALLFLDNGTIQRFDLGTREQRQLVSLAGAIVTHVAHSPDGQQIAYALNRVDPSFRLLGSEIVIAYGDGTNSRTVVSESEAGYTVGWPSWTDDPTRLLYAKERRASAIERVEEVDLQSFERTLLVPDGSSPTGSPRAPRVVYQRQEGRRWSIWSLERGMGEPRQLVDARWFDDVDYPKFAPDGEWIAFAGSGPGPLEFSQRIARSLLPSASAHGFLNAVYDLWMMRADGSGLRRVAQLNDLDPQVAWSPDGTSIAALGRVSLQIVDPATGRTDVLRRPQGAAPLSWGN